MAKSTSKKKRIPKVYLKELKTDRYGRIMAMVYLNGELINESMVKNGLALHLWDYSKQNKR